MFPVPSKLLLSTVFSGRFACIDVLVSSPVFTPLWLSRLALSPETKLLSKKKKKMGSTSVNEVRY